MRSLATRPGVLGGIVAYLGARRALVPFVASTGYVAALGVRADRGLGGRVWLVGMVTLGVAFVAASPRLPGNVLREDGRREVGRVAVTLWALALTVASIGGAERDLTQDLAGGLAALASAVTAARVLGEDRVMQGVAGSLPRSPRSLLHGTVGLLVAAFGLALAANVRALREPAASPWDATVHDAHAIAAAVALVGLAGLSGLVLRARQLVLDGGDRALTAFGGVAAFGVTAAGLLLLGPYAPDRVLRVAVAAAALFVTFVLTEGDAVTHARRGRRLLTLLLFGGPVVLLGGLAAQGPGRSFLALLVTATLALGIGSVARHLEQPLRRAEGRLMDAIDRAQLALVRADPETSMRDALGSLRAFAGPSSQSPELWSLTPPRVLTIDGAGYPHERSAELPHPLLEVAEGELEATVRTELLEALVVRRPDLRPLARWMDERGALSATLVTREGEVEGVLVLPRGARLEPMSLEEVRAVKRLADAFSGASAAESALRRSLERERAAGVREGELEEALLRREQAMRTAGARDRLVTARLAEPAMGGPYAPSARLGFEAIERRLRNGAPLVVVAPNGSAVRAYLARAHLAGPRGLMPFIVVDGANVRERDLARWSSPAESPLALAARGLLVLEDAARLPPAVQQLVADALAQRRAPWEGEGTLDVTLAVTVSGEGEALRGALEASLAVRLGDALTDLVRWPPLRERGEDLRSLVLAGLAREGFRVRGAPLGIEDAAFDALANYPYPGDDAELGSIVQRLALLAHGDVVRLEDVRKLGLPVA